MKNKHYFLTAIITKEGKWFVAKCAELGVVSQGKTIEEAQNNLKEATELYLEKETVAKKALPQKAPFITTFELKHV
jgi:predicted RNase H-like HicB family nuclease